MSRCVSFHEVSFDDVSLCSGLLANRRCILCASWIVCVNSLGYQQTRNTITRTISVVRVHIFLPLLPEWSHLPSHVSFMPTVPTVSLQFLHQITDTPCQLLLPLLHHLLLALHHQRHDHLVDETKESSVRAAMEMVMQLMTFRRGGNGLIA